MLQLRPTEPHKPATSPVAQPERGLHVHHHQRRR